MADKGTIVIVGGGLAAAKAAEGLRDNGYAGSVVLVGDEHHLPYERPPLSKGYLLGEDELESVFVHTPAWYVDQDVSLQLGAHATALHPEAHTVTVGDRQIGYDKLLLATGSTPRRLPLADPGDVPVAYLRTIEDSDRLKSTFSPGLRVVVIGGGWIGLEVAAAARTAGCAVDLVEALDKPLLRVVGPEVGEVFAQLHASQGVQLHTGVGVSALTHDAGRVDVRLENGTVLEADLVVVGIGVRPLDELASTAGLDVDDGVLVDERLRTSHPDVFAAGDVANALHPRLGRRVRVEHWDNAIEQGLAAARNLLGADEPYDRLPYFFSDQYDFGMEYVGHVGPEGYDDVVLRGDVAGRTFTAFWLSGGRVVAGMHANDWDAIDPLRRIVETGKVDLAALRDASVPLASIPD